MSQHQTFPTYLLRIPWYIVLEHLEQFPEKYGERKYTSDHPGGVKIERQRILRPLPDEEQEKYQTVGVAYPLAVGDRVPKIVKEGASQTIGAACLSVAKLIKYKGKKQVDVQNRLNGDLNRLTEAHTSQPESIRLQKETVEGLYSHIQTIFSDQEGDWERRLFLQEEFNKILTIYKQWEEDEDFISPYKATIDAQKKVWSADNPYYDVLHESLNASTWCMYERTDAVNHAAEWGIKTSLLHLGEEAAGHGGLFSARLQGQLVNGAQRTENFTYYGRLGFDYESGYLVVELLRSNEPHTLATITARVDLDSPHDQSLMVGYYQAYSQHYLRMLCKAVLLQRVTDHAPNPVDVAATSPAFQEINPEIRNFLANRSQNRLTMPGSVIAHLGGKGRDKSLRYWVDKRRRHIEEDAILKALQGQYVVCYYFGGQLAAAVSDAEINEQVRINPLTIGYNEQNVEFVAHYQHLRLQPGKEYWGTVSRKLFTIEIILKDQRSATNHSTDVNHIFLSFSVPITDENVLALSVASFPPFQGVISGLNDEELTPVAFAAVLVKLDPTRRLTPTANNADELLTPSQRAQVTRFFRINQKQLRIHMPVRLADYVLPNCTKWLDEGHRYVTEPTTAGIVLTGYTASEPLTPAWATTAFHSLDEAQREANDIISNYYRTREQPEEE